LLLPFPVNVYVRSLFRSLYLFLFEFQYRNWCELTRLIGSGPCVWEPLWLYGYIQSPGGHLSDATDSAIVSFSLAPIRFRIEANILPANCNFNLNWIELRQLLHSLIFQLIYAYLMHHPLHPLLLRLRSRFPSFHCWRHRAWPKSMQHFLCGTASGSLVPISVDFSK